MVASLPGRRPASIGVPFSVGMSAVSMMSFSPTVRPWRAPIGRPLARYSSTALAAARGKAGSKNAKALDVRIPGCDPAQLRLDIFRRLQFALSPSGRAHRTH